MQFQGLLELDFGFVLFAQAQPAQAALPEPPKGNTQEVMELLGAPPAPAPQGNGTRINVQDRTK